MRIGNYDIGFFYFRKATPSVEQRGLSLSNPATAAYFGLNTQSPFFNTDVNPDTILGIPPAWAAIRYISEGIASLNRGVFKRENDGDVFPDYGSPVASLFEARPHPFYTTFDFLQALVSNACMGNGYARIHRDPITMRPVSLEVLPQEFVSPVYTSNGDLYYHVCGTINETVVNVYLPETEIIHVKGVTFTGTTGKQLRLIHKPAFATATGAQAYSNAYFKKGATVGGVVSFPGTPTPEQRQNARANLEAQHQGAANAGSIMIIDGGSTYTPIQATPKDAAVMDFSQMSNIAVSQIFKVPLHLLAQLDRSTFSNMEQQNQDFVTHCLMPWAKKISEEFTTKLFTASEVRNRRRFFAFDLEPLLMGDMVSQASFFSSAIQNGWMTPNEVRAKKHLNKIEGGDQLFIQQNMAPMDQLEDILKGKQNGPIQETQTQTPDKQKTDDEQPASGRSSFNHNGKYEYAN